MQRTRLRRALDELLYHFIPQIYRDAPNIESSRYTAVMVAVVGFLISPLFAVLRLIVNKETFDPFSIGWHYAIMGPFYAFALLFIFKLEVLKPRTLGGLCVFFSWCACHQIALVRGGFAYSASIVHPIMASMAMIFCGPLFAFLCFVIATLDYVFLYFFVSNTIPPEYGLTTLVAALINVIVITFTASQLRVDTKAFIDKEINEPTSAAHADAADSHRMLARLSHDLRTPLMAILGENEVFPISERGLSGDTRKFLDIARRNGQQLDRMVNDVLRRSAFAMRLEERIANVQEFRVADCIRKVALERCYLQENQYTFVNRMKEDVVIADSFLFESLVEYFIVHGATKGHVLLDLFPMTDEDAKKFEKNALMTKGDPVLRVCYIGEKLDGEVLHMGFTGVEYERIGMMAQCKLVVAQLDGCMWSDVAPSGLTTLCAAFPNKRRAALEASPFFQLHAMLDFPPFSFMRDWTLDSWLPKGSHYLGKYEQHIMRQQVAVQLIACAAAACTVPGSATVIQLARGRWDIGIAVAVGILALWAAPLFCLSMGILSRRNTMRLQLITSWILSVVEVCYQGTFRAMSSVSLLGLPMMAVFFLDTTPKRTPPAGPVKPAPRLGFTTTIPPTTPPTPEEVAAEEALELAREAQAGSHLNYEGWTYFLIVIFTMIGIWIKYGIGECFTGVMPWRFCGAVAQNFLMAAIATCIEYDRAYQHDDAMEVKKQSLRAVARADVLLRSVGNELAEIMQRVNGSIEVLHSLTGLTLRQRESVRTMLRASALLCKHLALMGHRRDHLQMSHFNIDTLIDEAVKLHNPTLAQRDIKIGRTVHSNVPKELLGDEIRIHRILSNIIANSLRFLPQSGGVINVEVDSGGLELIGGIHHVRLKISVGDNGCGMDQHKANTLFDENLDRQVSGLEAKYLENTGLGLLVCKQFVHDMGGAIEILSAKTGPKRGTKITITLPVRVYTGKTDVPDVAVAHVARSATLSSGTSPVSLNPGNTPPRPLQEWDSSASTLSASGSVWERRRSLSASNASGPVGMTPPNERAVPAMALAAAARAGGFNPLAEGKSQRMPLAAQFEAEASKTSPTGPRVTLAFPSMTVDVSPSRSAFRLTRSVSAGALRESGSGSQSGAGAAAATMVRGGSVASAAALEGSQDALAASNESALGVKVASSVSAPAVTGPRS